MMYVGNGYFCIESISEIPQFVHDTNYKFYVNAIFMNVRPNVHLFHPKYINMKQIYMNLSQISDSLYFYISF